MRHKAARAKKKNKNKKGGSQVSPREPRVFQHEYLIDARSKHREKGNDINEKRGNQSRQNQADSEGGEGLERQTERKKGKKQWQSF